jgi:hypothetical protein
LAQPNLVLYDDHDFSNSIPGVALLPFDEVPNENVDDESQTMKYAAPKYCLTCYHLSKRRITLWSDAEVTYHMKGK